jgi:hypothetical protein
MERPPSSHSDSESSDNAGTLNLDNLSLDDNPRAPSTGDSRRSRSTSTATSRTGSKRNMSSADLFGTMIRPIRTPSLGNIDETHDSSDGSSGTPLQRSAKALGKQRATKPFTPSPVPDSNTPPPSIPAPSAVTHEDFDWSLDVRLSIPPEDTGNQHYYIDVSGSNHDVQAG